MGTTRHMAPFPFWWIKGIPGFAGPMITDTGLVFSGMSNEHTFRAFDIENGNELWQAELPTAANAVPLTYQVTSTPTVVIIGPDGVVDSVVLSGTSIPEALEKKRRELLATQG